MPTDISAREVAGVPLTDDDCQDASPPEWRLSLLEDPFLYNPNEPTTRSHKEHTVWIPNTTEQNTVYGGGGLWLPDDVVGEILLYIDESGSDGIESLLAVSAVSTGWRAVANRLPQWSALVRASKLPCPTFNRAEFLGTRNAVFRPYIQAASRQEKLSPLRGICVPVVFFLLSSVALLLGGLLIGDYFVAHDGSLGKCRSHRYGLNYQCLVWQQVVLERGYPQTYTLVGHIEKHFDDPYESERSRYYSHLTGDVLEGSVRWICLSDTFYRDLHHIYRLQEVGALLQVCAIPLMMLLGWIYARATSKAWLRFSAIGMTLAAVLCVASMTAMLVGDKKLESFKSTPCDQDHPALREVGYKYIALSSRNYAWRQNPGRGILAKVFAGFTACLILCAIGVGIHARFIANLWNRPEPPSTPEDAEVPPESIDPELAEQHDILLKYSNLIAENKPRFARGVELSMKGTRGKIATFATISVSVLNYNSEQVDSGYSWNFKLKGFDRRSLVMHLQHGKWPGKVADIGLGHRLNPQFPVKFDSEWL